jgi:hypothetical protein
LDIVVEPEVALRGGHEQKRKHQSKFLSVAAAHHKQPDHNMKRVIYAATAIAVMITGSAQATLYDVNRSITDGSSIATLTGTVDCSVGTYDIMNQGASPFTAVNLILTVNGTSYTLNNALTGIIWGTGQFLIEATPTTLTFSTATADGGDPADLVFSDNTTDPYANDRYVIGSNADPQFEAAYTDAGNVLSTTVTFPTIFGTAGTAVPEPTTMIAGAMLLLPFGASTLRMLRKR